MTASKPLNAKPPDVVSRYTVKVAPGITVGLLGRSFTLTPWALARAARTAISASISATLNQPEQRGARGPMNSPSVAPQAVRCPGCQADLGPPASPNHTVVTATSGPGGAIPARFLWSTSSR